jgi:hypothetical protein
VLDPAVAERIAFYRSTQAADSPQITWRLADQSREVPSTSLGRIAQTADSLYGCRNRSSLFKLKSLPAGRTQRGFRSKPKSSSRPFACQGAVVISDPNTEAIFASLQTPETERGMTRIPSPQMIVLDREILNFRWQ